MTFIEKHRREHPEIVRTGGFVSCPYEYGYEEPEHGLCGGYGNDGSGEMCARCWSREMPQEAAGGRRKPLESDPVNHPAHYTAGGIECIDAITAALEPHKGPVEAWLTGQVLKYLWRWPLKDGPEDLQKARWYLDRLIARVEGTEAEEYGNREEAE